MSIHIGEKIRKRAKELRVGPTELGKLIHTSRQNVVGIYKRKSIDAELLHKISTALQYDFFQFYLPDSNIVSDVITEYKKLPASSSSKAIVSFQNMLPTINKQLSELIRLQKKTLELLEKKK